MAGIELWHGATIRAPDASVWLVIVTPLEHSRFRLGSYHSKLVLVDAIRFRSDFLRVDHVNASLRSSRDHGWRVRGRALRYSHH